MLLLGEEMDFLLPSLPFSEVLLKNYRFVTIRVWELFT